MPGDWWEARRGGTQTQSARMWYRYHLVFEGFFVWYDVELNWKLFRTSTTSSTFSQRRGCWFRFLWHQCGIGNWCTPTKLIGRCGILLLMARFELANLSSTRRSWRCSFLPFLLSSNSIHTRLFIISDLKTVIWIVHMPRSTSQYCGRLGCTIEHTSSTALWTETAQCWM